MSSTLHVIVTLCLSYHNPFSCCKKMIKQSHTESMPYGHENIWEWYSSQSSSILIMSTRKYPRNSTAGNTILCYSFVGWFPGSQWKQVFAWLGWIRQWAFLIHGTFSCTYNSNTLIVFCFLSVWGQKKLSVIVSSSTSKNCYAQLVSYFLFYQ